jgi:8-oxo-dGTP diphosphatase
MENTVDCIFDIQGKYTVLIKRDHIPFEGCWALPGGRINSGEDLDDAVAREVQEETGVEIKIVSKKIPTPVVVLGENTFLDQIQTYGTGKDPRGGLATVYAVQLNQQPDKIARALKKGDDARDVKIFRLDELPELAFDHNTAIEDYVWKLKKYRNPVPATDIIIEYNNGIVLIERKNPPLGLAIPGGFAEHGLTLEENAVKEAKEETGLDVVIENMGRPFVFSNPDRDPRGHILSIAYFGKGYGDLRAGDDAKKARVYSMQEIAELIEANKLVFDHGEILKTYLNWRQK